MFNWFKGFKNFFSNFSPNIAIDLGTANTLVYISGVGVVLNQPSIVAMKNDKGNSIPYAFGNQAKMMVGKTPDKITIIRPLRDGVVADFHATECMIRNHMSKVRKSYSKFGMGMLFKSRVVICVPSTATAVEKRAIQDAAESAGAKEAFLIEEPMAAAIGAGLKVADPNGSMVIDIGGGTTEIAVISLGGVVMGHSLRVGGDKMDEAIMLYVKKNHNVLIGETTAEKIKQQIGCAQYSPSDEPRTMLVRGRSILEGIPKEITITEEDIAHALQPCINKIVDDIGVVLESTPPELAADISENGAVLTGGGALLKRFDKVICDAVGISIKVADSPLVCVARGCGVVLENIEYFGSVLFRQD